MRRLLLLLILLVVAHVATAQSEEVRVDYLVLVDVSGSMVGQCSDGQCSDIFSKVQSSLDTFLTELEARDRVTIAPFADGLKPARTFDIGTQRDDARQFVRELRANGASTHVYDAISQVYKKQLTLEDARDRVAVLLVFTDGHDNSPSGRRMNQVIQEFSLTRRENDWLYYSTLGVQLGDADRQALEQSGVATYNPNPRGEVRPIRVIQPLYRLLSFGNLFGSRAAERPMRFRLGKDLPAGLQITVEARFDTLGAQGVYANITPQQIAPAPSVPLKMALEGDLDALRQGEYVGEVVLTSSDPLVLIVPNRIRAKFLYQEPRTIASGLREIDFAEADPFRGTEGVASVQRAVPLTYNTAAAQAGGTFSVRVAENPANPMDLPDEAFVVAGKPVRAGLGEVDPAKGSSFPLEIRVRDNIKPGVYRGQFVLEDGTLQVDTTAGPRTIDWRLEVADRPWSALRWILTVLLALAILAALAYAVAASRTGSAKPWAPPVLQGTLNVQKPTSAFGQHVLDGRRAFRIGPGGDILPDAPGILRIEARRDGKVVRTMAVDESGIAQVKRAGSPALPFSSEEIYSGDELLIGPYSLVYL